MKRKLFLASILLACAAWGATSIRWTWQGFPIYTADRNGTKLELGLRSDGVVVWREITNTTNSPAETIQFGPGTTNIDLNLIPYWWTNFNWTNIDLKVDESVPGERTVTNYHNLGTWPP